MKNRNLNLSILLLFVNIIGFGKIFAQNSRISDFDLPEVYLTTVVDSSALSDLLQNFSVDKVTKIGDGLYKVNVYVSQKDFTAFESRDIQYNKVEPERVNVSMAQSYSEMKAQWNRYPTYSCYLSMMETFKNQYPNLCQIDTILAQTPDNHAILSAHITNFSLENTGRPSVFYISTIHGDEVVGYYLLLRLADYLLSNYGSDQYVTNLLDNLDIWICPLYNPDGTYYASDNLINNTPTSVRVNSNGIDLNRVFPLLSQPVAKSDYEPEVEAMMNFMKAHNLTLAANLHGGAEVFNYPWDTWTSYSHKHADTDWWKYVGRGYADTCHKYSYNYMTEEDNGITEGGDWYVITGSMQDYHNWFLGTRHVTIEVGINKVQPSATLPNYWNYSYRSLLNFMAEADYGIHGVVTDSLTGEPLSATIFVENHDIYHSHVETSLPNGDYHRPIKGGTYNITYSSPGYLPKTIQTQVADKEKLVQNVQLTKGVGIDTEELTFSVYPNPAGNRISVVPSRQTDALKLKLFDSTGRIVMEKSCAGDFSVDISNVAKGLYLLDIETENGRSTVKFSKM